MSSAADVVHDSERFNREQRAVAEIGRRGVVLETKVLALTLFALAAPLVLVTVLWIDRLHTRYESNRLLFRIGFGVAIGVAVVAAKLIARPIRRARREGWIEELAAEHQVTAEELRAALVS